MFRLFSLLFVILLSASLSAQSWEDEFWGSRPVEALAGPGDSKKALLKAWVQDDPSEVVRAVQSFLSSDAPPEQRALYWFLGVEKTLVMGSPDEQQKLAETALQDPSLKVLAGPARDALAQALLEMGNADRARQEWEKMKYLRDWQVLGPFPNTADSGYATAYPPEQPGSLTGRHPGLGGRPLEWRTLKLIGLDGSCEVEAFLGGAEQASYYAVTAVNSESPRKVRFALDRAGSAKVWLNGTPLFADASYSPAVALTADLETFPGELTTGWNTLMVKVNSDSTLEAAFRLRLLDPASGEPLALETEPGKAVLGVTSSEDELLPRVPMMELAGALERDGEKALFQSRILTRLGHYRRAADVLTSYLEAAGEAPWLAWHAHSALESAGLETEANTVLNQALSQSEGIAELEAARWHRTPELEERLAGSRRLVEKFPNSPSAVLELFAATFASELESESIQALELLADKTGGSSYLNAYASLMMKFRRSQQARERVQKALEQRPGDLELIRVALHLAMDQERSEEALALVKQALEYGGAQGLMHMTRGRILAMQSDWKGSELAYREALEYAPQSPTVWEQYGDVLKELGRADEAAEAFRTSLDFEPSARVRSKLSDTTGSKPVAQMVESLELEPLLAYAKANPIEEGSRILLDEAVITVWPDYSYEEHLRMVYEVKDQEAAESLQRIPRDFGGSGETFQIYRAHLVRPDGKEVDARDYVDEAGFRFPSVAAGDRLEIEYVVRGRKGTGFENAYWTQWFFQSRQECVKNRFTLITPKAMEYRFQTHGEVKESSLRSEGEWSIRQWELDNLPALGVLGIPTRDHAAWVDVSTVPDWSSVARWYLDLSQDRCKADPATRRKALDLTRGLSTEKEKIRALRNFLARDLQYQTTPFRNSAFIPTEGSRVLAEGYGDCKDKAALLTAMLAEVGIKSRIALVSDRSLGLTDFLPSPRFSHAINVIETSQGPLWVDSTSPLLSYDLLDNSLYAARALVVAPETRELVSIPPAPLERDRVEAEIEAELSEQGLLDGTMTLRFDGNAAHRMRALLSRLPKEQRERVLAMSLPRLLDGATASEVRVVDLEEIGKSLQLAFDFHHEGAGKVAGSVLILDLPWCATSRFEGTLTSMQNLKGGLETYTTRGSRWARTRLKLPSGWSVLESPKAEGAESPFGRFTMEAGAQKEGLIVEVTSELTPLRVEESDAEAFEAFLKSHEKALEQPLVLKKG